MLSRDRFKILILEDDRLFCDTLADFLDECGFETCSYYDGESVLEATFKDSFSLYLFDINVPNIDGLELLKSLRECGDETPAIFITSFNTKEKLEMGYRSGCDDYIKKPISLDELKLKINAIFNRYYGSRDDEVDISSEVIYNKKKRQLFCKNEEFRLKNKEIELLELLLENRGLVVSKDEIIDKIWDGSYKDGSLRVYINSLKKAIGSLLIENIRGVGYRLKR